VFPAHPYPQDNVLPQPASSPDGPYHDPAILNECKRLLTTVVSGQNRVRGGPPFDSPADYCTVRVTVPVAVVLPEVPVTVTT